MSRDKHGGPGERRRQEELDSILDAALDDLGAEEDDDNHVEDVASLSNRTERNKPMKGEAAEAPSPRLKGPCPPRQEPPPEFNERELEASLGNMMANLLRVGEQLGSDVDGDGSSAEEALEDLVRQMEQVQSSMNDGGSGSEARTQPPPPASAAPAPSAAPPPTVPTDESDVDRTVSKLLDDMARAGSAAGAGGMTGEMDPSLLAGVGEDVMEEMMREIEKMGQKGDADDVVDGMMRQLLSKDLMYEPMKQVTERFPRWLAESKDHLSEEEYNRYGHQYQYFQRIVRVYETEPDNFPRLMELMQDIQEFGQPPAEIIRELAPGLEFDEDGMPKMDGNMPMPFPGASEQCSIM